MYVAIFQKNIKILIFVTRIELFFHIQVFIRTNSMLKIKDKNIYVNLIRINIFYNMYISIL